MSNADEDAIAAAIDRLADAQMEIAAMIGALANAVGRLADRPSHATPFEIMTKASAAESPDTDDDEHVVWDKRPGIF